MITKEDVQYIASLARIHLPEDKIAEMTKNLEGILKYVDQLATVDVSKIHPTTHVLSLENVYREDVVNPSLPQEEALRIAVKKHNGFFMVPKVIE